MKFFVKILQFASFETGHTKSPSGRIIFRKPDEHDMDQGADCLKNSCKGEREDAHESCAQWLVYMIMGYIF